MTRNRKDRKKEQGFTLIEIIAVLVILGILAAVAVPKYFSLQEDAVQKSVDAAAAEAQARLNLKFAQALLDPAVTGGTTDGVTTTKCQASQTEALTDLTDDGIGGGWTLNLNGLAAGTPAYPILTHVTVTNNLPITSKVELSVPLCGD